MTDEMAVAIARRGIQTEYLALISMWGADYEFEYLVYWHVIYDLEYGMFEPSAVLNAYVGFRANDIYTGP
jgi:hypothetical protein